jgi:hypothetical protein
MQVELKIGYNTMVADLSGAELEVLTRITNKMVVVEDRTSYEGTGPVYPSSMSRIEWRIAVNPVNLLIITEDEAKILRDKAAQAGRASLVKSLLEDPVSVERRQQLANQLWYDSIWTQAMSKEFEVAAVLSESVMLQAGGFCWQIVTTGAVIKTETT